MTEKSLDAKLTSIHADPLGARDFILADAKDADMGLGVLAPGWAWDGKTGEAEEPGRIPRADAGSSAARLG
ncbi:MAG: hypothetical protein L0387_09735 [Acidobacteria bacterium]|nr:hypothetical protein [Acidobacteriota bacterium]MCI0721129.1 hypothetical protein [Acidobacteriota bacterium]